MFRVGRWQLLFTQRLWAVARSKIGAHFFLTRLTQQRKNMLKQAALPVLRVAQKQKPFKVGIKHLNVVLAFVTKHICTLDILRILLIWRNIIISANIVRITIRFVQSLHDNWNT